VKNEIVEQNPASVIRARELLAAKADGDVKAALKHPTLGQSI
jgi:hypothetical protein